MTRTPADRELIPAGVPADLFWHWFDEALDMVQAERRRYTDTVVDPKGCALRATHNFTKRLARAGIDEPMAYLRTVVKNEVRATIRRGYWPGGFDELIEELAELASDRTPEKHAHLAVAIGLCSAYLDGNIAEVLTLRLEGHDLARIADHLGIRHGTARNLSSQLVQLHLRPAYRVAEILGPELAIALTERVEPIEHLLGGYAEALPGYARRFGRRSPRTRRRALLLAETFEEAAQDLAASPGRSRELVYRKRLLIGAMRYFLDGDDLRHDDAADGLVDDARVGRVVLEHLVGRTDLARRISRLAAPIRHQGTNPLR